MSEPLTAEREEQVRADEREACCRAVCSECRTSHEVGVDDLRYEDGIGWHHYYGGEGPTWRGCKCAAAAIRAGRMTRAERTGESE